MSRKIELGDRVKDKVSGATGVVTGITEWITGCDTLTIAPSVKEDGKVPDGVYIDINRAEVIERNAVIIETDVESRVGRNDKVGGPQTHGAPDRRSR